MSNVAGPVSSSSMISLQRSMHSSQMYTPGPAMSFLTCRCDLPQKLQRSCSLESVGRAKSSLLPGSLLQSACRQSHRQKLAPNQWIGHFDYHGDGFRLSHSFACSLRILQERSNASASISTVQRGSTSALTTTIVAAGLMSPNVSPCALPTASQCCASVM